MYLSNRKKVFTEFIRGQSRSKIPKKERILYGKLKALHHPRPSQLALELKDDFQEEKNNFRQISKRQKQCAVNKRFMLNYCLFITL